MTLRLDSLYDVIVELEEKIEDAKLRRDAIKQQAITPVSYTHLDVYKRQV